MYINILYLNKIIDVLVACKKHEIRLTKSRKQTKTF